MGPKYMMENYEWWNKGKCKSCVYCSWYFRTPENFTSGCILFQYGAVKECLKQGHKCYKKATIKRRSRKFFRILWNLRKVI